MENVKKINITVKPDILSRADEFASSRGLSRSALFSLALNAYMDSVETMPQIQRMLSAFVAVSDGVLKGEMSDDEAKARLSDIKSAYKFLTEK